MAMAVREVLKMGDPRLAEVARPVTDFSSTELGALLVDMHDTMAAQNGAGLAAPQIGVPLRVVVFGYDTNPRYPDAPPVPPTILINPQIEPLDEVMEADWEGCLSVPGMRGLVARHTAVRYRGFDQRGRPLEREATGFHARVVQHECDHLDGVLYPQRVSDMRDFGFSDALARAGRFSGGAPCDDPPE